MQRILLLTNQLQPRPSGGRALLCKLNHDVLRDIHGDGLVVFELPRGSIVGLKDMAGAFRGHIDGLSDASIAEALRRIQAGGINRIFVDGSNLGAIVEVVKRKLPHVEVVTFFHNVEARFFLGALRQYKSPRALAVLVANYLAERKSVRYSDRLICLSERDSRTLGRLYGRRATHVSAMAMRDTLPADHEAASPVHDGEYALFVGGSFYANQTGIAWFAEHVAPRIPIRTCVVGMGQESQKGRLERHGNVSVIGSVETLAPWYRGARFVIAPIFDGSGMKTKVAEALMFGKRVIGTPEAFSGYEEVVGAAGVVCRSADDFEQAIRFELDRERVPFDCELRAIYEKRYSVAAATSRLTDILGILD